MSVINYSLFHHLNVALAFRREVCRREELLTLITRHHQNSPELLRRFTKRINMGEQSDLIANFRHIECHIMRMKRLANEELADQREKLLLKKLVTNGMIRGAAQLAKIAKIVVDVKDHIVVIPATVLRVAPVDRVLIRRPILHVRRHQQVIVVVSIRSDQRSA